MPRRFLKRILPDRHSVAQRWYLHPFRALMHQPAYWTVHRRSVVRAVAIGLFVCFIPLPIHFLLAPLLALIWRANVPLTLATVLLMNPLTIAPAYLGAYWVGTHLRANRSPHCISSPRGSGPIRNCVRSGSPSCSGVW
jgi:hypothetical protein